MSLLLVLVVPGCVSGIGQQSLPRDRFDYNSAIATSWKEQMLLNMVRLRYGEAPVFLNVASIIAQYSLEGRVSLSGGLQTSVTGEDTLSLQGTGRWTDRPTITYAQQTGQEFTRSLLTPPAPTTIFAMVEAGWPIDFVLGLTVRSIEGIDKFLLEERLLTPRTLNPEFFKVLEALTHLQRAGVIGLRQGGDADQPQVLLVFHDVEPDPEFEDALAFLRTTLHLPPEGREFPIVFGRLPGTPEEIAVLTTSVLETFIALARFFEVPAEHVEAGYTLPTIQITADSPIARPPIRVQVSKHRPAGAFVAIRNREYWFSIAESDFLSKSRFSFLMILLRLAESEDRPVGPVVTVGTGP
jgi:hypothetical protein